MSDERLKAEDDAAAHELKALLCESCYPSVINWITGRAVAPFEFCKPCAPLAMRWLDKRRRDRDPSLS